MPRVGHDLPVRVATEEIEPASVFGFADRQPSGRALKHSIDKLPCTARMSMPLVNDRPAHQAHSVLKLWGLVHVWLTIQMSRARNARQLPKGVGSI